ncbi:DUF5008 domain-containing protein [Mucilaginibacter terrae]|uniref:DUF5008 domain-containing protein n=1 Tax=Mucilaginibacter terrae TaxID=1955052 RepID=A0ABU3GN06_9SPHI|nr:DUF5008 domain-containing protein [Mucilaginibacter terrae]MDT3401153.1 hypothetical protein [Mucilaginibacter terrae]
MSHLRIKSWFIAIGFSWLTVTGCKDDIKEFENPYSGGKAPLGLKFNSASFIEPAQGRANDTITVSIVGAEQYKDKLQFQFSGEEAEILSIKGDFVKVKVPPGGSSGSTSVQIGDQVFFGPQFKVYGKVSDDPYFKAKIGANNTIYDAYKLKNGKYIMVGEFTDFNEKGIVLPIRKIAESTYEGEIQRSLQLGTGVVSGYLSSVTSSPNDANIFVAGNMSAFDLKGPVKNITRLTSFGAIDLKQVDTYSSKNGGPSYPKLMVPSFNGGTESPIKRIFYFNNGIIAVGGFRFYISHRYDVGRKITYTSGNTTITTYRDSLVRDSIPVRQVIRLKLDGSLDNTYHFSGSTTLEGANGNILDAVMQPDGKLILVGAFSKFDNKTTGGIVRLNTDGTVDDSFQVGKGASGYITSINWNGETQRFVLTGVFSSFNNRAIQNLLLLKADGSIDDTFISGNFDSGYPSFAQQLSNGLIVVSGNFKKYNNVRRGGFTILTSQGNLAQGYNSLGELSGTITRVLEERNKDSKRSIVLLGSFRKFDSQAVQNIKGLVLED